MRYDPIGPLLLSFLLAFCQANVRVQANDPEGVEFFERKIRPVLTEHCLKCHSSEAERAKKLRGGLYLDSRDGMRRGGDSGAAIVAGKPVESLLLKTLKYEGDIAMPPKGKLPDSVIADFEKWLANGAIDPRDEAKIERRQVGLSVEEGRKFWSYQPPRHPKIPAVRASEWAANDIDKLVFARLEAKGIQHAPEADRTVLIRRLYYDLIGLPPSLDEVDAFLRDPDPKSYEKRVDTLLASPRFGERWGRHWLDVARYAESVTLRGFIFKEAWRYRDYVIDSFDRDLPFDEFVREQIAGDLMKSGDLEARRRQLTATTFLTLGNTNFEEQDKKQLEMDFVDEQLDVISKGFLGQTVTCARCHDHKFDPIPTKDYYALAGILHNSKAMTHENLSKWMEAPLPLPANEEAVFKQREEAIAKLQLEVTALKDKIKPGKLGVLAIADIPGIVVDDSSARQVGTWKHSIASGAYIGQGYLHDEGKDKGEKTLTFQPESIPPGRYEVQLAYSSGDQRSEAVPLTVFSAEGEKTVKVNMKKIPPINGRYVSLGEYQFEKNGQAYAILSNEGTKGIVTADAIIFLPLDKAESTKSPQRKPGGVDSQEAEALRKLEAELKKLQDASPKRPMIMTLVETHKVVPTRINVRGSVHNLGEIAPRGFLQVASTGPVPTFPNDRSGRRELAEWIASKENPLTTRVIANRTWHWLFGSGIVRTIDNFGTTGERPSHPELLDHLAVSFVADGWSIKKLIRRIVLSQTYRQASTAPSEADPDNLYFGRANRRRLEAECIRDTMLSISGTLNLHRPNGPTYHAKLTSDYNYNDTSRLRSIYLPLFRNSMVEILEVFDGADPSMVVGQRNTSTVSPQALYFMNHPFPAEQAGLAARRLLEAASLDDDARIELAYRLSLGRKPSEGERKVAFEFVKDREPLQAWSTLFHTLFATADFRYTR